MFNRTAPPPAPPTSAPPASPDQPLRVAAAPPSTLADLPRIIDLVGYASVREDAGVRIAAGGRGAHCYFGPPSCAPLVGTELEAWVDGLFAHVERTIPPHEEDFRITYNGHAFRGCRDPSGDYGEHLTFRRLPAAPPSLSDLSMSIPAIRTLLEGAWLNSGGLVLLCGLTGQGKTTIAGATVRTRLETFHGRCVTVEDVIEMPLEGVWGRGTCRQIRVDYETTDPRRHGFPGAVRRAYRSLPATRPAVLYIGEVRDVETATEVVKAAANGMLVITTIHAGDVMSALMRLLTLAQQSLGSSAAESLAAGLRIVAHHTLDLRPDVVGWDRGRFTGTALVSTGGTSDVANIIKAGRFAALSQPESFQMTHLRAATLRPVPCEELLRVLSKQ